MSGTRSTLGLEPLVSESGAVSDQVLEVSSGLSGNSKRNPFISEPRTSTLDEFKGACAEIKALIEKRSSLHGEDAESLSVQESIAAISEYSKSIMNLLEVVNGLPGPGAARDQEIGEALLPLAILASNAQAPSGKEASLVDLYRKTHTRNNKPTLKVQDWLKPAIRFLVPRSTGEGFPDERVYIRMSESKREILDGIEREEAELQGKIGPLEEKNAKAMANGAKNPPFADVVQGLQGRIRELQGRVPDLFSEVVDVLPEEVPEAMAAIGVETALSPRLLQALRYAENGLHEFLTAVSLGKYRSFGTPVKLRVPYLASSGDVGISEQMLEAQTLASEVVSDEAIVEAFEAFMETRRVIAKLLPSIELSGVTEEGARKFEKSLREPFSVFKEHGVSALHGFIEQSAESIQRKCAETFSKPVLDEHQSWSMPLDNVKNARLIEWGVKGYLASVQSEPAFENLLLSSSATRGFVPTMLEAVRSNLEKQDYGSLIVHLNEQIQSVASSSDPHHVLLFVSMMGFLVDHPEAGPRLRHQVPEAEKLKSLSRHFDKQDPELAAFVSTRTHQLVRSLSSSMDDFLNLDGGEELVECIETYRFLMEHPNALAGLKGNEAFRSGLLLEGEPGVGKTHLVDCLANELGIEKLKISPEEIKDEQADMLAVAKRVCQEAKDKAKRGEFSILFIDEAEALLAERSNPNIPPEKERMCDYLLQELNDIRQNYPQVLIVVATNFIHRIDEAVLRDGRLDYHIRMESPNEDARRTLIETTLAKRKVQVDLSEGDLNKLVEISDGFMPLTITRAITEETGLRQTMRIEAAKEAGDSIPEISFDNILARFESERERHERRVTRKKEKARQFGGGEQAEAAQ